ncbi:uncharacterized protein LOC128660495 isoform X2 [Bombina bombina]|uniref:uncharacterized protein LOC128660495 isoform X2 n=1 Tax=Bombina bombina TaxID=8345 RepID=UPI00235AB399|nr:uncharacterized protein LOC128660495 isoform X2 [Bombina bombina]
MNFNVSKPHFQQKYKMSEKMPPDRERDIYQNVSKPQFHQKYKMSEKMPPDREGDISQNTRKSKRQGRSEYTKHTIDMLFLKDYMKKRDREPLIGLEYVLEHRVRNRESKFLIKYICHLCNVDSDLQSTLQHLTGYKHRCAYIAKKFPYVLKAPHSGLEDRTEFFRRMAQEIEEEEGIKMYKGDLDQHVVAEPSYPFPCGNGVPDRRAVDPATKIQSLLTLKIPLGKPTKKKTRWNKEENSDEKKKNALEFLERLEIDSESESITVIKLTQKLTALLKESEMKAKQETLFANRVAKAKDVAKSFMKAALKKTAASKKPVPSANALLNESPVLQRPFNPKPPLQDPSFKENPLLQASTFNQNPSIQGPLLDQFPLLQGSLLNQNLLLQGPQENLNPFLQSTLSPSMESAHRTGLQPNISEIRSEAQSGVTGYDQFCNKLMELLVALPQNLFNSESAYSDPRMILLQALLKDINPLTEDTSNQQNLPLNQKMLMEMASQLKSGSNSDASLIQQQLMLMTSENSPNILNQMIASTDRTSEVLESTQLDQNLMTQSDQSLDENLYAFVNKNRDHFYPRVCESNNKVLVFEYGNVIDSEPQIDTLSSERYVPLEPAFEIPKNYYEDITSSGNSGLENPHDFAFSESSAIPFNEDYSLYKDGHLEQQSIPLYSRMTVPQEMSEIDNEADDRVTEGNYSMSVIATLLKLKKQAEEEIRIREAGERELIMRDDVELDFFRRDISEPEILHQLNRRHSRPPYMEFEDEAFRTRSPGRYSDDSVWVESRPFESGHYNKRTRLDTDHFPSHCSGSDSGLYYRSEEQSNFLGINTEGLPADVLNRIRGKDLFTVSAILREYEETRASL